ncbi:MAG: hypothetical protein C4326_04580 [Ignavibacteria bacterium]
MVTLTEIQAIFSGTIRLSEPLARYTALQVGGPADYLLEAGSAEEVERLEEYFRTKGFPVLGLQKNMLVSDRGFRGAVILDLRSFDPTVGEQRCAPMFKPMPHHARSVAALIEQAGLHGLTWGGAAVLADCVVNADNARASDILALVLHVQRMVRTKLGIELELALQCVGFDDEALANVA